MSLEFLKPIGDFQYSVNLEYDLMDDAKVKSYVPTISALNIIKDILNSVMNSSTGNRAKILTGAYGKGKSHLTLTIMALLSGRKKTLFQNLLNKCKKCDVELYNNIKLYLDSKKKLLPIVINTASNSLKTNFANSLNIALKNNGLDNLMPDTFFDVAIETINTWQNKYPDTYIAFEKKIGLSGQQVKTALKFYNQEIYDNFCEIYPLLTSGIEFNPMVGTDIKKLYEKILIELKTVGYSGIFVVYDEFGKFLEGSADTKSTAEDLKLLQDLAELSSRTKSDAQFNLLLISHKGIDNYVGHLSKEKIDNWKAIAGRFEKLTIESNDTEVFEIISSVLKKDDFAYKEFKTKNEGNFETLNSIVKTEDRTSIAEKTGAFDDVVKTIGIKFVEQCYPLHPYTLLMLPKISELVAQNERSIFTYLAADNKNTVTYFAKRTTDEFPIIEPDALYDYFESLFKGEPYGSPIREQWEIASSAIAKLNACDNDLSIKIVKTITLIYIINQFEILPPSSDLVYEIYKMHPLTDIKAAFAILRKEELLIELEFKPFVKIRKSSNNNIKELIEKEISAIKNFDIKKCLQNNLNSKYVYPLEYNDNKEITRYFEFMFISSEELLSTSNINALLGLTSADGVVLAILLNEDDKIDEFERKIKKLNSKRIVFVLPKNNKNINFYLKKYEAINNLLIKKHNDNLLVEELEFIQKDLYELIQDYLEGNYLKPELHNTQYFHDGKAVNVKRRKDLSQLLSNICEIIYCKTPVINNENINRNNISATMKNARKKILEALLASELQAHFNLEGSQNINVARSLFVVPKLIEDMENPKFNYDNCDILIKGVLKEIEKFFDESSHIKQKFSILYNRLVNAENGYGLKLGIIPFYVAVVLRKYKQRAVVYYKNREQEINSDLLIQINSNPEQYEIKVENLGEEEEEYLKQLSACFNKYTKTSDLELSRFDYIVKAIQRWYLQLSKFDRESRCVYVDNLKKHELSRQAMTLKKSLSNPDINPREYLFEKLPQIIGNNNLTNIASFVSNMKHVLDKNTENFVLYAIKELKQTLKAKKDASLHSALQDYYEQLKESTQTHVFNNIANSFLVGIKEANNDELQTMKNMLKRMYSLRVTDFTDDLADNVKQGFEEVIKIVNQYDANVSSNDNVNSYIVKFVDQNGEAKELHFDNNIEEKNYQAKMFYNEITSAIEEFNEALSDAEKGNILLEVLKELCVK